MPPSKNEKAYESIWQTKKKNPSAVIAQLCKKYSINYPSYNNWVKRHKSEMEAGASKAPLNPPPPVVKPKDSATITVRIPLRDVLEAVKKDKPITIPRDQLIEMLPTEQKQAAYEMIAKAFLRSSKPKPNTQDLASDDGELSLSRKDPFDAKADD